MRGRRLLVIAVAIAALGPWPVSRASAAGLPVLIDHVVTDDRVVFITIDDGFTPVDLVSRKLREWKWPVTSFVISGPLHHWAAWFATLGPEPRFGNHTRSHMKLVGRSLEDQKSEICGGAADVAATTGARPAWFRPPGGGLDATTYSAAAACGVKYIVRWRVTVNGPVVTAQGGAIRAGDIILLHYRADLAVSLAVLKARLDRLGLRPASLDDYLDGAAVPVPGAARPADPLPTGRSPWLAWLGIAVVEPVVSE